MTLTKKLNTKQQRFVEEYMVDLNATQAAIRAGYSKKTAYSQGQRLLKHVEIQKVVTERRKALSEKTEVSIEAAIKILWDSAHRCLQLKPVLNAQGEQMIVDVPDDLIPVYGERVAAMVKHNPAAAHKAIEIILRHLGGFTAKFEVTGKGGAALMPEFDTPAKEIVRRYITLRLQVNDMDEETIREAMKPFEKMLEQQAQQRDT